VSCCGYIGLIVIFEKLKNWLKKAENVENSSIG
jgi:hypothetical protein